MRALIIDTIAPEGIGFLEERLTDLATVLAESDVITVHVPLTDETENMIAAHEIAAMKRGVRLVNCARGGIVHDDVPADVMEEVGQAVAADFVRLIHIAP